MKKYCILYFAVLIIALTGCGAKEEAEPDVFLKVYQPANQYNESFSKEELDSVMTMTSALTGVNSAESEGISYFSQMGTDYSYDAENNIFRVLDAGSRMKSADLLLQADLTAGALPETVYEVVVSGTDETLIGKSIRVCFAAGDVTGECDEWYSFDFVISGIQSKTKEKIYFSQAFCETMIRGILGCDMPECLIYLGLAEGSPGIVDEKPDYWEMMEEKGFSLGPFNVFFRDDSLKGAEVYFGQSLYDYYGAIYRDVILTYDMEPDEEKSEQFLKKEKAAKPEQGVLFFDEDDVGPYQFGNQVREGENEVRGHMKRILSVQDRTRRIGNGTVCFVSKEVFQEIFWKEYSGANLILRVKAEKAEETIEKLREKGYGVKTLEEGLE